MKAKSQSTLTDGLKCKVTAGIMQHSHILSPTAHFDAVSSDLLRGDFTSVTREVLTVATLIRIALTGGAIFAAAAFRSVFHTRHRLTKR
jgi:hypothetical protein